MLTNTIPRLVRGRVYRYDRFMLGGEYYSSLVGVFEGKGRYDHKDYGLLRVLAFDMTPKASRFIPVPKLKAIYPRSPQAMPYTITEIPPGDMLLFVNYKQHTDLYKELLADPALDLRVRRKRRARVRRALQKSPLKSPQSRRKT